MCRRSWSDISKNLIWVQSKTGSANGNLYSGFLPLMTVRYVIRYFMGLCHNVLKIPYHHAIIPLGVTKMVDGWLSPEGTVTLRLHRDRKWDRTERRATLMLTIEGLIAVISLCVGCFSLGYAIGRNDNHKTQK